MKVMRLLAVGKSIRLKHQPSPYRVKDRRALPKFQGENGKKAEVPESITTKDQNAAQTVVAAEPAVASIEHSDPQPLATPGQKSGVLPGWMDFRRRFRPSTKEGAGLVQTELSLDTVRVIRNDLQESSSTQPSGEERLRKQQRVAVTEHWWTRLQRRLFARARKQD